MSALLFVAGCSSSGSQHSSHSGVSVNQASYAAVQAQTACPTCGPGYHSTAHAHSNQTGNAIRHSHAGGAGHAHGGYSASYDYIVDAGMNAGVNSGMNVGVNAGGNTVVRTGVRTAAASNGGGSGTLVKIAGALLVGGLIYNVTKDDDDDNNTGGGGVGGDDGSCGSKGKKPC